MSQPAAQNKRAGTSSLRLLGVAILLIAVAIVVFTGFHVAALVLGAMLAWSAIRLIFDPVAAQHAEARRRGMDDPGHDGVLEPRRSASSHDSHRSTSGSHGSDTVRVRSASGGDSYDNSSSSSDSSGSSSSDSGSSSSSD